MMHLYRTSIRKKLRASLYGRGGFAVPTALLGLVSLSLLVVVSLSGGIDQQRGANAIRSSIRPFWAAEAGLHEVLEGWATAGYDTTLVNSGDSVVTDWETLSNGCRWRSHIRRVDDGTGSQLFSVTVTGEDANGLAGSRRQLRTLLTATSTTLPLGIVTNGDSEVSGNPTLTGCAGVFVNGNLDVSGTLTTDGVVEAEGNVSVGGSIEDSNGDSVTPTSGAPSIQIPELQPSSFCGDALWALENGRITNTSTGQSRDIDGNDAWGWKWDSGDNTYELKGDDARDGTVCADGNIKISDNPGSSSSPLSATYLAEGYVEISGNPFLTPSHPDGVVIVATGDLKLNGNSSFSAPNFGGTVFGGAQCEISGTPALVGSLICYDNPDPPGAKNLVDGLKFNGDLTLFSTCGGSSTSASAAPVGGAWSQGLR